MLIALRFCPFCLRYEGRKTRIRPRVSNCPECGGDTIVEDLASCTVPWVSRSVQSEAVVRMPENPRLAMRRLREEAREILNAHRELISLRDQLAVDIARRRGIPAMKFLRYLRARGE